MDFTALIFAALKSAKTANERIDNLPLPMVFKGSLGTGGTISTLPTASSANEGYVYIVITDGTYAGQTAKAGDIFISDGSEWVLVPSADEPSVIDDSVISTALTWSSKKISDVCKVKTFTYTGTGTSRNHRIDLPSDCGMILTIIPMESTPIQSFDYMRLTTNIPIFSNGSPECQTILTAFVTGTSSRAEITLRVNYYDGYITMSCDIDANSYNLNKAGVEYTVYYI